MFNMASRVTAGTAAGAADIAYITDGFSVTCNHNLQDVWGAGKGYRIASTSSSLFTKKTCIEGEKSITGTTDISLDDGGRYIWNDVMHMEKAVAVIAQLDTSKPSAHLTSVYFNNAMVEMSDSNSGYITSVPFTAFDMSVCSGL